MNKLSRHAHHFAAHGHEYVAMIGPLLIEHNVIILIVSTVGFCIFVLCFADKEKK